MCNLDLLRQHADSLYDSFLSELAAAESAQEINEVLISIERAVSRLKLLRLRASVLQQTQAN